MQFEKKVVGNTLYDMYEGEVDVSLVLHMYWTLSMVFFSC
jgi:hypothetical protein